MKSALVWLFLLIATTAACAQDLVEGKRVFMRCMPCHNAETDKNKVGPTLKGLFGRIAGSLPGYSYSKAMREAGEKELVWGDESLAEFLVSPKAAIPGTNMTFAGLKKDREITDLIAYLKQFP